MAAMDVDTPAEGGKKYKVSRDAVLWREQDAQAAALKS